MPHDGAALGKGAPDFAAVVPTMTDQVPEETRCLLEYGTVQPKVIFPSPSP